MTPEELSATPISISSNITASATFIPTLTAIIPTTTPTPYPTNTPTTTSTPSPIPLLILTQQHETGTPTPRPTRPTRTPTSTPDISDLAGVYKTYHNDDYGFKFDYPAVFDEGPYPGLCALYENDTVSYPTLFNVNVGHRTWIYVVDAQDKSLSQYLDDFVESAQANSEEDSDIVFMVTSLLLPTQENGQIFTGEDGEQYATIEYRFGITNRYGRKTVFLHNSNFIEINFTAGLFCDFPEINVHEVDASLEILDSFQVTP
ncbi:MAG: hypothetical protein AAF490_28800 [Chloroflexota bacterium]